MGSSNQKQRERDRQQKAMLLFGHYGKSVPSLQWLHDNTEQSMGISDQTAQFRAYRTKEQVCQYFQQILQANAYRYDFYSVMHQINYSYQSRESYNCVQIHFQRTCQQETPVLMKFSVQYLMRKQKQVPEKIAWVSVSVAQDVASICRAIQQQSNYKAPQSTQTHELSLPPRPYNKPDPEEVRRVCQENQRKYHIGKWNQHHK